jgi:hypothetical protein
MVTRYLAATAIILSACAPQSNREQARIMDEIEGSIRLPGGSRSLGAYARYYAHGPDGDIVGEYILPGLDSPNDEQCAELNKDMTSRIVPCSAPAREGKKLRGAQRVWLNDWHNLPGGISKSCGVVSFVYKPRTRRFEGITCVGENPMY